MKKLQYLYRSVGLVCIIAAMMFAKEPDGSRNSNRSFMKSSGQPNATLLNINRMSSWYESNGKQEQNPFTGNSGLTYPRGTTTAIFSSGLMWGGYSNDAAMASNQPRVSGQSYNSGTSPGAILGYRTGVTEDPTAADVRIWRVRRDYATADLKQDAAEINSIALSSVSDGQIGAVRTQYATDWKEWPWKKGAPFYDIGYLDENLNLVGANNKKLDWGEDVNQNAVLDVGEDVNKNSKLDGETPGAADADQVIWYVANDIRAGDSPWKTKPLGLEMQVTIWGYNRTDALGNMLFKKFKLIYKGHATTPANGTISNMYLCQWSDPDLGDAGDDYAGCDISLSLGYIYNSTTQDKEYRKFSIAPPAAGFDFLQGPKVLSATDTAVFDLKYRPGAKNLPMTSFIYFAGSGNYTDPGFNLNGSWQWYSMFLGGPPTPQPPPYPGKLIDPVTKDSTTFWLSGNPEDNSNPNKNPRWIDGLVEKPGDRRILLTSGPFNMALGDTQELVSALIGGVGSDYISSIKVLKFYDKTTQAAYNNLFNLPKPPKEPKFTYVELDRGIVLEWERDSVAVVETETSNSKGFVFEGYNVYQLPSATSPLSNAKKLATYDLPGDPSTISQEDFDEGSGQILTKPVQVGKNSGLTRYLYITKDEIRNKPLVNGQQYFFAITAYNFNPDPLLVTKSFESTPNIAVIVPHTPNPGIVHPYTVNDVVTIPSTLENGDNDASIGAEIFNPTVQNGGVFEIWYGGTSTPPNYTIVKIDDKSTDMTSVFADLRATNQVPADSSRPNAKGFGRFTLNDAKTSLKYRVSVQGLSGPITAAHIHKGARGVVGGTVHKLGTFVNGVSDSAWVIPDSLLDDFTAGNLYVNVHTAARPGGEIRDNISTGLFARTALQGPYSPPAPSIKATYTAHRFPDLGLNFFAVPSPKGPKSVEEIAPGKGSVLDNANPSKAYSVLGPLGQFAGAKDNESDIFIEFNNDIN
ncbi:MAG: CHRD domain-containing protein, partial [Bacteriovoracaceae bacterium]